MSLAKRFEVKLAAEATQANIHVINSNIRKAGFRFKITMIKESVGKQMPTITLLFLCDTHRLEFCEKFNMVNEVYLDEMLET